MVFGVWRGVCPASSQLQKPKIHCSSKKLWFKVMWQNIKHSKGALGLYECCCGTYLWFSSKQGTPETGLWKPSDIRIEKWKCVKQNKKLDIWIRYALTMSKKVLIQKIGGPYGSAYPESAWTVIFNKHSKIYSSQVIYKHLCLFCSLRCQNLKRMTVLYSNKLLCCSHKAMCVIWREIWDNLNYNPT